MSKNYVLERVQSFRIDRISQLCDVVIVIQVITFQCMADLFLGSIIIMLRWFSQKGEVGLGRERREKER